MISFDAFVSEFAEIIDKQKVSAIVTPLQPHQKRVVDRMARDDQPGLVVAHGLGSGKTLTSIAVQDRLGIPADVIVPAALQGNYEKELRKHHDKRPSSVKIKSLQNMAVKRETPSAPLMIVDEAHRLRDDSTESSKVIKGNKAKKRLLLTGSPVYNHPADVAPLVNIVAGKNILPADRAAFEQKYVSNVAPEPGLIDKFRGIKRGYLPSLNKNKTEELAHALQKWVDYHEGSTTDFPDVSREDVRVEMTPEQLQVYDTIMGQAPAWVRAKVRMGLPPNKQEAKQLNNFLGGVRQISNSTRSFQQGSSHEPKIQKAYEELKKTLNANPKAKAVIYSNFLASGIDPYKKLLEEGKIPYGEFSGRMSKKDRDALVADYNENRLRALLISSAGGEGLDLKGTRLMQILEPHWNDEKLRQVEGRGIRYKSHADLPEGDRNVRVQRYLAVRPRKGILEKLRLKEPGMGVDEYLTSMSERKNELNKQFKGLLARPARSP